MRSEDDLGVVVVWRWSVVVDKWREREGKEKRCCRRGKFVLIPMPNACW